MLLRQLHLRLPNVRIAPQRRLLLLLLLPEAGGCAAMGRQQSLGCGSEIVPGCCDKRVGRLLRCPLETSGGHRRLPPRGGAHSTFAAIIAAATTASGSSSI